MSPNLSLTYLLTVAEVLPRPEEAVKEAVKDVQGQLKQIGLRSGIQFLKSSRKPDGG